MLEAGDSPESIVEAWRKESQRFFATTQSYRLY
ncbi:MAG: hypothetical protein ACTMKY_16075 [Dermabacteraceae bacterium]